MERVDFEIRGYRYQLEGVPVSKARPLLTKLLRAISKGHNVESFAGADSATLALFLAAIQNIDDQLLNDIVAVFTPYTFFERDGLWPCMSTEKNFWDLKGMEGLGDQFEWIKFCLTHTYSDFLTRLGKPSLAGATP